MQTKRALIDGAGTRVAPVYDRFMLAVGLRNIGDFDVRRYNTGVHDCPLAHARIRRKQRCSRYRKGQAPPHVRQQACGTIEGQSMLFRAFAKVPRTPAALQP